MWFFCVRWLCRWHLQSHPKPTRNMFTRRKKRFKTEFWNIFILLTHRNTFPSTLVHTNEWNTILHTSPEHTNYIRLHWRVFDEMTYFSQASYHSSGCPRCVTNGMGSAVNNAIIHTAPIIYLACLQWKHKRKTNYFKGSLP